VHDLEDPPLPAAAVNDDLSSVCGPSGPLDRDRLRGSPIDLQKSTKWMPSEREPIFSGVARHRTCPLVRASLRSSLDAPSIGENFLRSLEAGVETVDAHPGLGKGLHRQPVAAIREVLKPCLARAYSTALLASLPFIFTSETLGSRVPVFILRRTAHEKSIQEQSLLNPVSHPRPEVLEVPPFLEDDGVSGLYFVKRILRPR